MAMKKTQEKIDAIALAQKCIGLIDTTQMSATYKPATFMALLTVIAQNVDVNGQPPKTVSVADLGREVMRLFWYQALPYQGGPPLKQTAGKGDIVTAISEYRVKHHLRSPISTLDQAKSADAAGIKKLELRCIKTVADNPVKFLHVIVNRFLDRIMNGGGSIHNVYNNGENVHTNSIQKCVKESIIKIFLFSL